MGEVFFDTSAFVKRYIHEPGSDKAARLLEDNNVVVSSLCLPETISTCSRLLREERITTDNYGFIKHQLFKDSESMDVVPVDDYVISLSMDLLENGMIRTLDALHVASALSQGIEEFATSDKQQAVAAEQAGLSVVVV
jgi:hypothetical protein